MSKLPHKFWAEVLSTAAYLRNRSPTKAIEGMTPYEAWMKKKPQVDHLHVFGCDAYAHIPKDELQKLDVKTKIFWGMIKRPRVIAIMTQTCAKCCIAVTSSSTSMSEKLILKKTLTVNLSTV